MFIPRRGGEGALRHGGNWNRGRRLNIIEESEGAPRAAMGVLRSCCSPCRHGTQIVRI